jgi:hypothetical protein
MKKNHSKEIKELVDFTKVTRNEAYKMYIEGKLTRDQMYDYLHERVMWLLDQSKNERDNS